MILFFDTETTGLADFNKRARDPAQPHIVSLAAILTTDEGTPLETYDVIIKPDGWTIPKEASDVHGITNEIAEAKGIPEKAAAATLLSFVKSAGLTVAHNLMFDKFIARIAMRRYELFTDAEDEWWKGLPTFCTMKATMDLCRLPGNRAGSFKWPKLIEAYRHIFNRDFELQHNALADVTACMQIYFWLKNGGAK